MTDETDRGRKFTRYSAQEVLDDTSAYANSELNTTPQGQYAKGLSYEVGCRNRKLAFGRKK